MALFGGGLFEKKKQQPSLFEDFLKNYKRPTGIQPGQNIQSLQRSTSTIQGPSPNFSPTLLSPQTVKEGIQPTQPLGATIQPIEPTTGPIARSTTTPPPAPPTTTTPPEAPGKTWFTDQKAKLDARYLTQAQYDAELQKILTTTPPEGRQGAINALDARKIGSAQYNQELEALRQQQTAQRDQYNATAKIETHTDADGYPTEMGYYDWEGNWVKTKDLMQVNAAMRKYADYINDPNALANLQKLTETASYADMDELLKNLKDPTWIAARQQEGLDWVNRMLGLGTGGFQRLMANLLNQLNLGVEGQAGLTAQEKLDWRRKTQLSVIRARNEGADVMAALSASGRDVQAYRQMEGIAAQASSIEVQDRLAMMTYEDARQQVAWDAAMKEFQVVGGLGEQYMQQSLDLMKFQVQARLEGYAQQITAIAQQNQTEIAVFNAHADAYYKNLMAQIGWVGAQSEAEAEEWKKKMDPWLADLQKQLMDKQLEPEEKNWWGNIISGTTTGAGIGSSFMPGWGTLIGGVVGALGGFFATLFGGNK